MGVAGRAAKLDQSALLGGGVAPVSPEERIRSTVSCAVDAVSRRCAACGPVARLYGVEETEAHLAVEPNCRLVSWIGVCPSP
jgi:hypothetical protein